jgi:coniferyl-aldehyde dehydrogenase
MSELVALKTSPVHAAYKRLRDAQRANPFPTLEERRDWLERLERVLCEGAPRFAQAIDADFGGRSRHETLLVEVMASLESVRDARRSLASWMRPRRVSPSPYFLPGRAWIEPLPLGVVGIIAPWNYPVNLLLGPLVGALAAGNRAILKPSEVTPRTAELLGEVLRERFSADELAVVEGGADVAEEVTHLHLDHLFFTGSTAVGRKVALAAAANLVPVTLELGGKCPAWIHPDYPIPRAAERIALGKLFNAGQTCIAPDYVLVARGREEALVTELEGAARRTYPGLPATHDYSSVVSARHHERLMGLLDDAKSRGARLHPIGLSPEPGSRKIAPTLVLDATIDMKVMQEEIFGPILPVIPYGSLDEARQRIADGPRPLALYYFDEDSARAEGILRRTISGGATLNDTLVHFAQDHLPFGGVGASGQGAYHGRAGFERFSHLRGVLDASALAPARSLQSPPYGKLIDAALAALLSRDVLDVPRRVLRALRPSS